MSTRKSRGYRILGLGALAALMLAGVPYALGVLYAQRGGAPPGPMQEPAPEPLKFQYMGPANAGRISAAAGVPGDTATYYAGAASGGIWKSTDSAKTFIPVFDDQPVQAIGALAVAPSDPKIVWAGTGEAWAIRDADVMGDGVYKSTDAGATWKNMGLGETGRIGRIIVHPKNPSIVFACALGRTTGPQQERGVFRTTDGGGTWQRVLFVNPDTGCSGLAMDANDPNVLIAGTWQVVMHTYAMFSGGSGSGLHISRDGGTTWTKMEHPGLPKPPVGKIDVAIAPSDSKRMYALIQTANQGSLWRSDDAGASWRVVSWDRTLIGRAGYYIRVAVNPVNPDEVLVANSSFPPVNRRRTHLSDRRRRVRRLPRYLDGSEESRPLDSHRGWRDGHHHQSWPKLHQRVAPHRTDVSRGHRQPGAVLDLQQPPGRRHHARAEQLARARAQRADPGLHSTCSTGGARGTRRRRRRRFWRHGRR